MDVAKELVSFAAMSLLLRMLFVRNPLEELHDTFLVFWGCYALVRILLFGLWWTKEKTRYSIIWDLVVVLMLGAYLYANYTVSFSGKVKQVIEQLGMDAKSDRSALMQMASKYLQNTFHPRAEVVAKRLFKAFIVLTIARVPFWIYRALAWVWYIIRGPRKAKQGFEIGTDLEGRELKGFEKIFNCRDVGGLETEDGTGIVKRGKFFRSAIPSNATENDVKLVTERLGVKTVVDLRFEDELEGWDKLFDEAFPLEPSTGSNPTPRRRLRYILINKTVKRSLTAELGLLTTMAHLALYKIGKLMGSVLNNLFGPKVARHLAFRLTYVNRSRTWFAEESMKGRSLYFHICHSNKEMVREILHLVADPANQPILVHCVSGKDRTGVIAALFLLACGVSREDVERDFTLSHSFGMSEDHLREALRIPDHEYPPDYWLEDVDTQSLLGSPRHMIKLWLDALEEEYGSIENYLDDIGCDEAWRHDLRKKMITQ